MKPLKTTPFRLAALPLIALMMCAPTLAHHDDGGGGGGGGGGPHPGYHIAPGQPVTAPVFGKTSSISETFDCPPGWVMATISLDYGWDIGESNGWYNDYINGVSFGCSPLEESGAMGIALRFQDYYGYPALFGNDEGPQYNFSDCYPNHWLGLHGRSGDWLDQVGQNCSNITDLMNGVVTLQKPAAGGTGGSANQKACPDGHIPVGANIYITWNTWYIQGIELKCSRVVEGELDNIARRAGEIAAAICPSGINNCDYGRKLYQFIDVDSLGYDVQSSWLRKLFGMQKTHPKTAMCVGKTGSQTSETRCFNNDDVTPKDSTLFEDIVEFRSDRYDHGDHYTWATYHYEDETVDWFSGTSDFDSVTMPLLLPPQERSANQQIYKALDMRDDACWPDPDDQNPWDNASSSCRKTIDLSRHDVSRLEQQGQVYFIRDSGTLASYVLNTCRWDFPENTLNDQFAVEEDVDLPPLELQCTYAAETLAAIDYAFGQEVIEITEAYNLLAQGAWLAFSLGGGELLALVDAGEDAALAARLAQLRTVFEAVNTTGSLAMNALTIYDAAVALKECPNSAHPGGCRAANIGAIALSTVFMGLDALSAKNQVSELLQPLGPLEGLDESELQPLIERTREEYQTRTGQAVPEDRPPEGQLTDSDIHNHDEPSENPPEHEHEQPPENGNGARCPCPGGCA